jgi:hypothetical protein
MKFLSILVLLLSSLPSLSQEGKAERTCRVIYLQRPADAPEKAHLFDGALSHEVQLSGMNFSEVVKLPEGDLVLGMTADPVAAPEDFPTGAPTVKIPAQIIDLYLIVGSDPENKVFPVRMLPLDVGGQKLKAGETLWINLTAHSIKGMLGKEPLAIAPSGRVVGKSPLAASGYYKAAFLYQPDSKGDFLPVMKKTWWFDANSKNLGFVIDSGGRLPRIFTFRDHRTPEAKETAGNPE